MKEISNSITVRFEKDAERANVGRSGIYDIAGTPNLARSTGTATTSDGLLDVPSLFTAVGYLMVKNLDDTNFLDVGAYDGVSLYSYFERLFPGDERIVHVNSAVATPTRICIKADTASVEYEYAVVEE